MISRRHKITLAILGLSLGAAGCELLVDFDRTKIDGGGLDGSPDITVNDVVQNDQTTNDSPNDVVNDTTTTDASDGGTGSDASDSSVADSDDGSSTSDGAADDGADE